MTIVSWLNAGTTDNRGGDMHAKQQSGFTLVEMAVVVFLIGILATLGITALNTQLANAAISATQSREYILKDALMNYLRVNKRLPCPATDSTGGETRTGGTPSPCKGNFGYIPYATLGLPKSAGLDGWNNFFSYAVSPQWTLTYNYNNGTNTTYTTIISSGAGSGFLPGANGAFTIDNRSPTSPYPIIAVTTASNLAAVVIVSHGIDGLGAFTYQGTQNASDANGTDQAANTPNSTTWALPTGLIFYQRDYTATALGTFGAFDDMVVWLGANDLLTPLMKDGAIPSAQAQWATQNTQINNALAYSMFTTPLTNCPSPAGQSAFITILTTANIPLVDPWGGTLTYNPGITGMAKTGITTPIGAAFPYSIVSSATNNPGVQIPTNAALYSTYATAIQNNCN